MAVESWRADRDEAEAIFARYGRHLVSSIPDMVRYWITKSGSGKQARARLALEFAITLHKCSTDVKDPTTLVELKYPLGLDVACSARIRDRVLAGSLHSTDIPEIVSLFSAAEGSRPPQPGDVEDPMQVLVPAVLGSTAVLAPRDAVEVWKHLQSGDDTTATKLATAFGSQTAGQFALTLWGDWGLDPQALHLRLQAALVAVPSVVYRALTAMNFLGPGVFAVAKPPLWPKGFAALPPDTSLALMYARHLEACFEDPFP